MAVLPVTYLAASRENFPKSGSNLANCMILHVSTYHFCNSKLFSLFIHFPPFYSKNQRYRLLVNIQVQRIMVFLKDKVALITGASSGLGAVTAEYFASLGCNLVLTARNEKRLSDVKSKCVAVGLKDAQVWCLTAEMRDNDRLKILVDSTVQKFGKLDILVNCAGIVFLGHLSDAPIEQFDEIMDVNVRSIVLLTKLCLPHLKSSKGTIVNVSSIAGQCALFDHIYYCMSKASLDQMTKCLALEMAPHGVRVNSVNPGLIPTEIHNTAGVPKNEYIAMLEKGKKAHPLGRNGEPIEVAKAIGFLASDDSSFTTGALFGVDGGRMILSG